jgi:hypothetical protein
LYLSRGEIDRTIIHEKVISGEFELLDGLAEIGFHAENGKAGAGDPDASLDGDWIVYPIALPFPDSAARDATLLFEAELPGAVTPQVGQSFTGEVEVLA